MAEYSAFTKDLLDPPYTDRQIAENLLGWVPDKAEVFETPMMRRLLYELEAYDRIIALCEMTRDIWGKRLTPLRSGQLPIIMINAERRKDESVRNTERATEWLVTSWEVLKPLDMKAPGVCRTWVMWYYNAAQLRRLLGAFAEEAEHYHAIIEITSEASDRDHAEYMMHFATILHHAAHGTAAPQLLHEYLEVWARHHGTLDHGDSWDARKAITEWGHRVRLVILLGAHEVEALELEKGFGEISSLLAAGVPGYWRYTADLVIAITLFVQGQGSMARHIADSIVGDDAVPADWRMLASLLKAQIVCVGETSGAEKADALRAVISMPGDGICHAARAVAERMLATY